MSRRLLATGLIAVVLACIASGNAAAHTITPQAALTKAGQVARARGLASGANQYYAFGCQRRSGHVIDCIGAIVFPAPSGSGAGGGETAICAIHQSVCISG